MLTRLDARSKLLLALAGLFTTSLVVGDLIGSKLFGFDVLGRHFTFSAGFLPFPLTFLLTDVLNEFYGKRIARAVTWVGFAMAVFTLLVLTLAVALPWDAVTQGADWQGVTPASFDPVFGGGRRILVASLVAYLVAQFTDIWVFNQLKRATQARYLWLRATGSTVFSQLIDTVVIQSIAWSGTLDVAKLSDLILVSYTGKLLIAVGLTPLIYAVHGFVERVLKLSPVRLDAAGEAIETG